MSSEWEPAVTQSWGGGGQPQVEPMPLQGQQTAPLSRTSCPWLLPHSDFAATLEILRALGTPRARSPDHSPLAADGGFGHRWSFPEPNDSYLPNKH